MKTYIYLRVSTSNQDNENQNIAVQRYIESNDIEVSDTIRDSASGTVPIRKRSLGALIDKCMRGDTIIVSELSRFSRNQREFMNMVWDCQEKGVVLYCVGENLTIDENNTETAGLLSYLGSGKAESELVTKSFRIKNSLDYRKELIAKNGQFISKKGNIIVKLGGDFNAVKKDGKTVRELGVEASAKKRREAVVNSLELKKSYALIIRCKQDGDNNRTIAATLNNAGFKTVRGFDWLPSSISQFIKRYEQLERTNRLV